MPDDAESFLGLRSDVGSTPDRPVANLFAGILLLIAAVASFGLSSNYEDDPPGIPVIGAVFLGVGAAGFSFSGNRRRAAIWARIFAAITGVLALLILTGIRSRLNTTGVVVIAFLWRGGLSSLLAIWAAFILRQDKVEEGKDAA